MSLANLNSLTLTNLVHSSTPSKTSGSLKASSLRHLQLKRSNHTFHPLVVSSSSLFLLLCQTPPQVAPEMLLKSVLAPMLSTPASVSTFSVPVWDATHRATSNGASLRFLLTDTMHLLRVRNQSPGLKPNVFLPAPHSLMEVAS